MPASLSWFDKIRKAHDTCTPLRLSPGDASSLWKCLRELEVDTASHAELLAAANGSLRKSPIGPVPATERK